MTRRVLLAGGAMAGCARRRDELPTLATVPAFSLTDQSAQPFNDSALRGRPWLASFFFASCAGPCPRMNTALFQIQESTYRFAGLRILSITVDPDNDTPEVLARVAKRYKADPARWTFLTGPIGTITALAREGFLAAIDKDRTHSTRVMLVDGASRLRGAYPLDDVETAPKLLSHIETLYGTA
jgi:protein SCO1